jgi:hypothetical protein
MFLRRNEKSEAPSQFTCFRMVRSEMRVPPLRTGAESPAESLIRRRLPAVSKRERKFTVLNRLDEDRATRRMENGLVLHARRFAYFRLFRLLLENS